MSALRVEHVGRRSLRLNGSATGRTYAFTPADPVQTVDARDVAALLRTGLFRLAR